MSTGIGLDQVLADRDQRRTWIVQHHVDRRIGARRRTLAIWSTESIGSSTISACCCLAVGRHQHVAVRLLPASGEGREHERVAWACVMPGKSCMAPSVSALVSIDDG